MALVSWLRSVGTEQLARAVLATCDAMVSTAPALPPVRSERKDFSKGKKPLLPRVVSSAISRWLVAGLNVVVPLVSVPLWRTWAVPTKLRFPPIAVVTVVVERLRSASDDSSSPRRATTTAASIVAPARAWLRRATVSHGRSAVPGLVSLAFPVVFVGSTTSVVGDE